MARLTKFALGSTILLSMIGGSWYWLDHNRDVAPDLSMEPAVAQSSMVSIPGRLVQIGSEVGNRDSQPARYIYVDSFEIDRTEVTNEMFAEFVKATGFRTDAERKGVSMVFDPNRHRFEHREAANWRQPLGIGSTIVGRSSHPVVHVSYRDAKAYATWAGKVLPTEIQWESAARFQNPNASYTWPKDQEPSQYANLWQGNFPVLDRQLDDLGTVGKVQRFPAQANGLFDMCGNVAEWTESWYAVDTYDRMQERNPTGPISGDEKVVRGGSWISSDQTGTSDAMIWYRSKLTPNQSNNFIGFRCVKN